MINQPASPDGPNAPAFGNKSIIVPQAQAMLLDNLCSSLGQVVAGATASEDIAQAIFNGMVALATLSQGSTQDITSLNWDASIQQIPGMLSLLTCNNKGTQQSITCQLDSHSRPASANCEWGGEMAGGCEITITHEGTSWIAQITDFATTWTVPLGSSDPGWAEERPGLSPSDGRQQSAAGVNGIISSLSSFVSGWKAADEPSLSEEVPVIPVSEETELNVIGEIMWYYLRNGEQVGPLNEEALLQEYRAGSIDAQTLVWNSAMSNWQTISVALPDFIRDTTPTVPAPPAAPPPPPLAPPPPPMPVPSSLSPPLVMSWHYLLNGQQLGPVDEATLQQLLTGGSLTAETLLWREGMAGWLPVREAASHLLPVVVEWFYLFNGQQVGPVSEKDLRTWLQEGRLSADCMVWSAGLSEWQEARRAGLVASSQPLSCRKCGAAITPDIRFCGRCGQSVI